MKQKTLKQIYDKGYTRLAGNNDKGSVHTYIPIYEYLLKPYRDSAQKVLEIGVAQGYSLRMWNEYFNDKCTIKGIDIQKAKLCCDNLDVTYGDSQNAQLWNSWDNFDVIIDDGDHSLYGQVKTAEVWLPKLKRSGIYIIEDVVSIDDNQLDSLQDICEDIYLYMFDMRYVKNRYDDIMIILSYKDNVHTFLGKSNV